jgi:hypothetical protein
MRKRIKLAAVFSGIIVFILMLTGCACKKDQTTEHFGTQVNHPTFNGPGDFFESAGRAGRIFIFGKLDGGKVLKPWVETDGWLTPAFREELCLIITMNNHCVG